MLQLVIESIVFFRLPIKKTHLYKWSDIIKDQKQASFIKSVAILNHLYLTRVTLNSRVTDKPVALEFQVELEFRNVSFWGGKKKRGTRRKTPRSKDEN